MSYNAGYTSRKETLRTRHPWGSQSGSGGGYYMSQGYGYGQSVAKGCNNSWSSEFLLYGGVENNEEGHCVDGTGYRRCWELG